MSETLLEEDVEPIGVVELPALLLVRVDPAAEELLDELALPVATSGTNGFRAAIGFGTGPPNGVARVVGTGTANAPTGAGAEAVSDLWISL